jgi:hypothetical protein
MQRNCVKDGCDSLLQAEGGETVRSLQRLLFVIWGLNSPSQQAPRVLIER